VFGELVLIVDDEPINRLLLKKTLTIKGYRTQQAKDGKEALSLIAKEQPDIILLDVMMPEISGFEVCNIIKSSEATKNIPVILVTALNSREDIKTGVQNGADEFITKPVDTNELLVRIKSLLKIKTLNEFMERDEVLSEKIESFSWEFNQKNRHTSENIKKLLNTIIKVNLREENKNKGKPEGIYLNIDSENYKYSGCYQTKQGLEIQSREMDINLEKLSHSSLGHWIDSIFISNWQDVTDSLENYYTKLPREFTEKIGFCNNFILFSNKNVKLLMTNFLREITPFDVSWLKHIIRYTRVLVYIIIKMGKTESEYLSLMNSLTKIAEIQDDAPGKHSRVSRITSLLCKEFGFTEGYTDSLIDSIPLFDIGKILLDQNILIKEKPLSPSEWDKVHHLPDLASVILDDLPRLALAKEIAQGIFERWDGTGYPLKKRGNEIPLSARIISLAYVYDTLRSPRSYRPAFSHEESMEIILQGDNRIKPSNFDPQVLEAFLKHEKEISLLFPAEEERKKEL